MITQLIIYYFIFSFMYTSSFNKCLFYIMFTIYFILMLAYIYILIKILFQIQMVLQDMKDKFQTMSDQILLRNILF